MNKGNIYNNLSKVTIVILGIYLLIMSTITRPALYGESSNYLMEMVALENHASLFFKESDYQKAAIDFPEVYPTIQLRMDNNIHIGKKLHLKSGREVEHGWYAATYSLCCIPLHIILKLLKLPQSYCFQLTNVIFYLLALCLVYLKLNISEKNKFITILLLSFSPGIFHILWLSAEVFICSLIIISLIFWTNKSYKYSCLFCALACTMNPTIGVLLFVIFIDYFLSLYKLNSAGMKHEFISVVQKNMKEILEVILFSFISVIPFIYNYIYFGTINLSAEYGSFNDYTYRYISYLFDLNFGLLPYFGISLIIFILLDIIGIIRRNKESILYFIAFFGTIGAYSIMCHINCGVTAIHRYNSWIFPIFIFYLTTVGCNLLSKNIIKKMFYNMMYCSAVLTTLVVFLYGGVMAANIISYVDFAPMAKIILNYCPSLYNPYHYTFVNRTNHEDGGYHYEHPVIYTNDNGDVRKILVTPSTVSELKNKLDGNENSLNYLNNRIENIENKKDGFYYINISNKYNLRMNS